MASKEKKLNGSKTTIKSITISLQCLTAIEIENICDSLKKSESVMSKATFISRKLPAKKLRSNVCTNTKTNGNEENESIKKSNDKSMKQSDLKRSRRAMNGGKEDQQPRQNFPARITRSTTRANSHIIIDAKNSQNGAMKTDPSTSTNEFNDISMKQGNLKRSHRSMNDDKEKQQPKENNSSAKVTRSAACADMNSIIDGKNQQINSMKTKSTTSTNASNLKKRSKNLTLKEIISINAPMNDYVMNELVLATVPGYCPWPARILSIIGETIVVEFFGTGQR